MGNLLSFTMGNLEEELQRSVHLSVLGEPQPMVVQ